MHDEVGVKGQKCVRDVGVEMSDELGNLPNFLCIDITRHKQGAGYNRGWERPFRESCRCSSEVIKGLLVRATCQGDMQVFIEGLEIELHAAAAPEGELQGAMYQAGMHRPGGLPTNDDTLSCECFPRSKGVRHLAGWVATEETDAVGTWI